MQKYNAWELKGRELPEDVNSTIVEIVARFQHPPLIEAIERVRKGQLHGTITLFDTDGVTIAKFSVRRGIVYDGELQRTTEGENDYRPRKPYRVQWRQHLRNDLVSWRKDGRSE